MNALIQAATDLQAVCEARDWRYCFIGGLAVLRWGEPRETIDVDLTLLTGFSNEAHYIDALTAHFEPRQAERLDWTYVLTELAPLVELKEAPGIMEKLQRLRERLGG